MQPTATISPTANCVTSGARAGDAPDDLVAGHDGETDAMPHSPRTVCRSE